MKILLIISLLSILPLTSWSQPDTIFKQKKVPKQASIEEQFYVLKTNRDIKYGPYVKYMVGNKRFIIIEAGRYVNDKKEGKWNYFYYGSIDQIESQGYYKNDQKNGYWEYFYYDYSVDTSRNNPKLYSQKKTSKNEYSVGISIKSVKKSKGNYFNDNKVGIWNYYDRKGGLMLTIDHSKDSVLFIDRSKIPPEAVENGSYKPFFIGGKEYFDIMIRRFSINEIDKTGILEYLLQIDKSTTSNKLVIKSNSTSENTETGFNKRLSTVLDNWIPRIEGNKIVSSEVHIAINVITEHDDSHVILKAHPYQAYNSSSDYFRYKIEIN